MIRSEIEAVDGHRYHLDPRGDDTSGDGSRERPWRNLARLTTAPIAPGDEILLVAPGEYPGTLVLAPGQGGTPEAPVVVRSHGEGRAVIRPGDDAPGVAIANAEGIELRGLEVVGPGAERGVSPGVVVHCDLPGNVRLRHIRLEQIEVDGFARGGVVLSATHASGSGFDDVVFEHVDSHDNGDCGISIWGHVVPGVLTTSHRRVSLVHCRCWDNHGLPGRLDANTGSGIVLSGVDGGLVEYCEARHNGRDNRCLEAGPMGIWCYHARSVVVQHCIAHHNRSASQRDGGGFDLDGGCQDCVLQHNYSYDNDGPGFLLAQYPGAAAHLRNRVRFNLSQNDARRGGQGAIQLWADASNGGLDGDRVHHNTVFVGPGAAPPAAALRAGGEGPLGVAVANNLLLVDGACLVDAERADGLRLVGNVAWSATGGAVRWRSPRWQEAGAWLSDRKADEAPLSLMSCHGLRDPGRGAPLADPETITSLVAYRPTGPSPDTGDPLSAFGLTTGVRDLAGRRLDPTTRMVGAFAPCDDPT